MTRTRKEQESRRKYLMTCYTKTIKGLVIITREWKQFILANDIEIIDRTENKLEALEKIANLTEAWGIKARIQWLYKNRNTTIV